MISRIYLNDIPVDIINENEVIPIIDKFIKEEKPHHIITLNSIIYNTAIYDPELKKIVTDCSLSVADSIGIVIASKFITGIKPVRIPGIDLMLKLCKWAEIKGYSVYLLGSHIEVVTQTVDKLKKSFPNLKISGFNHGYFSVREEDIVLNSIIESDSDILFVALSVPKQEKWINRNLSRLNVPVVIGVGGSFDVISGKLKRAPKLLRYIGIEWLFRFIQEPWRWKYLKELVKFVLNIIKLKWNKRNT